MNESQVKAGKSTKNSTFRSSKVLHSERTLPECSVKSEYPRQLNGEPYDLVVIGAGPAGSAAAIWGVTHGLRTLLVDRTKFPRHRPGECLHPGIATILQQLGVLSSATHLSPIRPHGCDITISGMRTFKSFGADASECWRGYHVERRSFDQLLVDRARECGTDFLCSDTSAEPLTSAKGVYGVRIGHAEFTSRFLLDASGRNAWLTRALGQRFRIASPRLTAWYGYCAGKLVSEQSFNGTSCGWEWLAQVNTNEINWTIMRFDQHNRPPPPAIIAHFPATRMVRGADVTWRLSETLAGNGYFVAGDAAAIVDPASSHGVLRALMSGIKAAHNAIAVLHSKATHHEAQLDYRHWLTTWFEDDTNRLEALYKQLNPDWCLMRTRPLFTTFEEAAQ